MNKLLRVKSFNELSEAERNLLIKEEFQNILKKYSAEINPMFDIWMDCKKLGLVEFSEQVLKQLIEHSIKEKRTWMLKKIHANLGRRNLEEKKKVEKAIDNFVKSSNDKDVLHENFEVIKIVERNLKYRELFEAWMESLDKGISLEEFRIVYLGVLIHGLNDRSALGLSKILNTTRNKKTIATLEKEFSLKNNKKKINNIADDSEPQIHFNLARFAKELKVDEAKININLIDQVVIKRYLNDILFSLLCLKDFKSIYNLSEVIDFNFKKNSKEYLSYNFYKLSALIEEKKFRQVVSHIKNEILNLPLTKKEVMPFFYLLAESYTGLEKYEKALEIFLTLQEDKIFHGKAKIRLNEIKKN